MSDVIPTALDVFIEEVRSSYKEEMTEDQLHKVVRNLLEGSIENPRTSSEHKEIYKLLLKEFDSKY